MADFVKIPREEVERDYQEAKRYEIALSVSALVFVLPVFWLFPAWERALWETNEPFNGSLLLMALTLLFALVLAFAALYYWWKAREARKLLRLATDRS